MGGQVVFHIISITEYLKGRLDEIEQRLDGDYATAVRVLLAQPVQLPPLSQLQLLLLGWQSPSCDLPPEPASPASS